MNYRAYAIFGPGGLFPSSGGGGGVNTDPRTGRPAPSGPTAGDKPPRSSGRGQPSGPNAGDKHSGGSRGSKHSSSSGGTGCFAAGGEVLSGSQCDKLGIPRGTQSQTIGAQGQRITPAQGSGPPSLTGMVGLRDQAAVILPGGEIAASPAYAVAQLLQTGKPYTGTVAIKNSDGSIGLFDGLGNQTGYYDTRGGFHRGPFPATIKYGIFSVPSGYRGPWHPFFGAWSGAAPFTAVADTITVQKFGNLVSNALTYHVLALMPAYGGIMGPEIDLTERGPLVQPIPQQFGGGMTHAPSQRYFFANFVGGGEVQQSWHLRSQYFRIPVVEGHSYRREIVIDPMSGVAYFTVTDLNTGDKQTKSIAHGQIHNFLRQPTKLADVGEFYGPNKRVFDYTGPAEVTSSSNVLTTDHQVGIGTNPNSPMYSPPLTMLRTGYG